MDATGRKTQWVLGFDGGCGTCGRLAQELVELSGGTLTAKSLRSVEVQGWRERALGGDAPWVPTLFAVEGESVRAWTGKGLVARLGRLVGPHKLWRIATVVGGLMDQPTGPSSSGRRLVLRRGLAGTATALVLLGGGASVPRSTALAAAPGGNREDFRLEKLKNANFKDLQDRAEKNRHFQIIRNYFAQEDGRDWRSAGRDAYRLIDNGRRERDGFWVSFKNPGETEWVHVMFTRTANGAEKSEGWLFRGKEGKFTDRFFVQNGNLRRDNGGQVEGARTAVTAAAEIGCYCTCDEILCEALSGTVCGVATAPALLGGPWALFEAIRECTSYGDSFQQPCVNFADGSDNCP